MQLDRTNLHYWQIPRATYSTYCQDDPRVYEFGDFEKAAKLGLGYLVSICIHIRIRGIPFHVGFEEDEGDDGTHDHRPAIYHKWKVEPTIFIENPT